MSGGREIGDAHVQALAAYIDALRDGGGALPERNGKTNLTAIAKACGFNREVLYQNPRCKALLAEAASNPGLAAGGTRPDAGSHPETAVLERRIAQLERQNAALYAEVHELRRQLKQFEGIEAVKTESGRRVIP